MIEKPICCYLRPMKTPPKLVVIIKRNRAKYFQFFGTEGEQDLKFVYFSHISQATNQDP